jgi:hypothetical protein
VSNGEAAGAVEVLAPANIAGRQLSPAEVTERAAWVREVTKAALTEGVDYGVIPGTPRPSLLKPGAEMLLLAGGLGFTITKIDDEDSRHHRGVTYRCSIRRGDFVVAECDGYAGYDESRFFISAEDAERREREYAESDQRQPRRSKMVEYRAPWNSVIKMAQKRALVGAALNAVAGSGLFSQDLEDDDRTAGDGHGDDADGAGSPPRRSSSRSRGRQGGAGKAAPGRTATTTDASAVTARAAALPAAELQAFTEWRESRNMPWPPSSNAVAKQADKEIARLEEVAKARGESGELISDDQAVALRESFDTLGDRFPTGDQARRLAYVSEVVGRKVPDAAELTRAEADDVLVSLRSELKS